MALPVVTRITVAVPGLPKENRNFVGPTLRRLRLDADVTQMELTARLQRDGWDISRQVLSFVEDGSRLVTDKELFAILRALGHNPSDLDEAFRRFCSEIRPARQKARRKSDEPRKG